MRVLIIYGTAAHMQIACGMHAPDVHFAIDFTLMCSSRRFRIEHEHPLAGPDEVIGMVVSEAADLHALRGMNADVVLEDHSFDLYLHGAHSNTNAVNDLHTALRNFGSEARVTADTWELWKTFIHTNVVRKA